MLAAIALLGAWVVDHPRVSPRNQRTELMLELVLDDREALRRHVEERLNAPIVDVRMLEIDYVRETTRVRGPWTDAGARSADARRRSLEDRPSGSRVAALLGPRRRQVRRPASTASPRSSSGSRPRTRVLEIDGRRTFRLPHDLLRHRGPA